MAYLIRDIADALEARFEGDGSIAITGAAEPASAGPSDLALAGSPDYAEGLSRGQARAALVWDGADWQALGLEAAIIVPRPRYAMSGITRALDPGPDIAPGIHPMAQVDPTAEIGEGAAIGPFVAIGADVRIGPRARIASHVSIGRGSRIGADALLHPGVRIAHGVTIGDRFIAQSNAVIGGDGFSFVTPEKSRVEGTRETLGADVQEAGQSWTRIHSLGGVEIGDDVEIGALSAIDRGTIRASRIGRGTKIDNIVQLGHNVVVGEDCLICGHVGVGGSTRIGNRVVLGGGTGLSDNIFVGDDVVTGGRTGAYTNIPAGRVVLGTPALKMETEMEIRKALRRLPRLARDVAALKKAVPNWDSSD